MRWPRRGEIWQANLSPTSGREQQGHRPVLIVSREAFNPLAWFGFALSLKVVIKFDSRALQSL
ncbi:MAG: type II toxin-antitoxin system PemK/MazF family toxin [Acidithiobacillus sp.]|nr:type II toxin-antitoxin system PemK/MazF family toxin [Acidithiobacillus sp.]